MLRLTVLVPQGVSKASVKLPRVLLIESTEKVFPVLLVTVRLLGPSEKITVPVGFTEKLTVPPLCFENSNGLGVVVTVTTHGVGVGLGFVPGEADGEAEGLAPGLAAGLAPGDADGLAPGDGDAVGSKSTTSGVGLGDGESPPPGVGVGVGDGCGVLLAPRVDPLSIALRFAFGLTFGISSR